MILNQVEILEELILALSSRWNLSECYIFSLTLFHPPQFSKCLVSFSFYFLSEPPLSSQLERTWYSDSPQDLELISYLSQRNFLDKTLSQRYDSSNSGISVIWDRPEEMCLKALPDVLRITEIRYLHMSYFFWSFIILCFTFKSLIHSDF